MMAAINILLLIGRIILFILLGLICLLIFLLLVPVFYRIEAELDEANRYPENFQKIRYRICIMGIPVIRSNRKKKKKKPPKNKSEQTMEASPETAEEDFQEKSKEPGTSKKPASSTKQRSRKVRGGQASRKKKKALDMLHFIREDESKELMVLLKNETFYLLKHFGPRRGRMELHYNLADPSNTGLLTAAISTIPLFYKKGVALYPDFTEDELYLYGKVKIGGHVRMIHGVRSAFHIFMNKRFRQLLKKGVKKNVRK